MTDGNKILAYLSLKYDGDWDLIYQAISNKETILDDKELIIKLETCKAKYITILDSEYPESLKQIYKPPFVLFYYGDISLINNHGKILGVVGSRECSEYGSKVTQDLVSKLANDYIIVSGMALGIDSVAHQSAIDSKGKTIAVLGSGIDYCYPIREKELYNSIKKNHLLLSEYPGTFMPNTKSFPCRNRIIAGLSKGLLVPEAKLQSGSMITVRYAIEQGKSVMAVPDQIGHESGCNALIKEGAALIETADDVIFELSGSW